MDPDHAPASAYDPITLAFILRESAGQARTAAEGRGAAVPVLITPDMAEWLADQIDPEDDA